MKLFLFGGAEIQLGQFIPQLELIEKVILEIKPKQIFEEVAKSDLEGLIFTYVRYFEDPTEKEYIERACDIFRAQ